MRGARVDDSYMDNDAPLQGFDPRKPNIARVYDAFLGGKDNYPADREVAARTDLHASFPGCPVLQGGAATSLIKFVTDRPGHDRRYAIDSAKIERELGFKPTVSLAEGLRRTVVWYLSNAAWWQSVMDGRYKDWITAQYQRR